jgi:hypothetical protein
MTRFNLLVMIVLASTLMSCLGKIDVDFREKGATNGAQPGKTPKADPIPIALTEGSVENLNLSFSYRDNIYVRNSIFSVEEDFNSDGYLDIVVSRGFTNDSIDSTYVYSGKDNSLLLTLSDNVSSSQSVEHFIANDLNNDGIKDIIVFSVFSQLNAYSGSDGSLLWQNSTGQPLHSPVLHQTEDIDSDGVDDIVMYNLFAGQDDYTLVSGTDGTKAWSSNYSFSGKITNVNTQDEDADGLQDLLVEELRDGPYILSSATGSVITGCPAIDSGINPTGSDSYIVGDDYDDDGQGDYIRFHYDARNPPAVFSSGTCSLLYSMPVNGSLTSSTNLLGDVDSDGVNDFFIEDKSFNTNRGSINLISGVDGSIIMTISGAVDNAKLTLVNTIDDINNDGHKDLYTTHVTAVTTNVITVYSGKNLSQIHSFASEVTAGEYFDVELFNHDLNGDGVNDLVISNSMFDNSRGKIYFYSGSNGELLKTLEGENENDLLSGVTLTDIDADGNLEINFSASGYNVNRGKMYTYDLSNFF